MCTISYVTILHKLSSQKATKFLLALCLSLFTGVYQKTTNQDACDIVNCNTESTHNNLRFDTVNAESTLNSETINEEHMDRIKHETNSNEEATETVNYKQYKRPHVGLSGQIQ